MTTTPKQTNLIVRAVLLAVIAAVMTAGCTDDEMTVLFDYHPTEAGGDGQPPIFAPPAVPTIGSSAPPADPGCTAPIAIAYQPDGQPYAADGDLHAAADTLTTGLGGRPVTITVTSNPAATPGAVANITVQWNSHIDATRILGQTTAGIGHATVELSPDAHLPTGHVPGSFQVLMMHELGHAAGLDHVADPHAVMHAGLRPDIPPTWSPAELTALADSPYACHTH